MAAKSSPGGFVVATVTNPGSFMATITHPTGNGYCWDRILRDRRPLENMVIARLQEVVVEKYLCTRSNFLRYAHLIRIHSTV